MIRKTRSKAGFTLMEVIIAIVILAGSLVVILGLESSALQRTYRDRTKQRAILLGRSILAAVELHPEDFEDTEMTMPAYQLAEDLLGVKYLEGDLDSLSESIEASLRIESQEIPAQDSLPIRLKRITLRLFWSENDYDSFEVIFYIPDTDEL